jgi:hypothetical protein
MVVAAFAEEPVVDDAVDIKLVQERIAILAHTSRENHNFIQLSNTLHKLIHTRTLNDVDVVICAFNFDGDGKVCLVEKLRWGC